MSTAERTRATGTAGIDRSQEPGPQAGGPLQPITAIEANSPIESLTVYRALVVCHIAGAVFAVVGWLTTRGATSAALQTPTLVVAAVQLVAATWLLRHPVWLPRLVLGFPRWGLGLSVVMTLFYLAPATDPVSPPTTTVAFAWIATAAAVLPTRAWPACGVAAAALISLSWVLSGAREPGVGASAVLIGAAAILPGCLNGAWMGSQGARVARRLRRWGLVIGEEAGALDELRDRAAEVRRAADEVLQVVATGDRTVDAISVETLRRSSARLEQDRESLGDGLRRLVAELRVPFDLHLAEEGDALVEPGAYRAVRDAILRHLTNVHLHAPTARTVRLAVTPLGGAVEVTCADDGGGQPPAIGDEGEGTHLSRSALEAVGGTAGYRQGPAGVELVLTLPEAGTGEEAGSELGLVRELRRFIALSLRNNRYAAYASPVPFLLFGMDGVGWWALPLLLGGGLVIEVAFRVAGPAEGDAAQWPVSVGAAVAVVVTLLFAIGLRGDQSFVCSAATAYPVIELAWRGRWRAWLLFEVLRGLAVLPWLLEAGAGGLGGAFVLPVALTLIAVGARRLVMRAVAVEARFGTVVERRRAALDLSRHASLRHDVVDQLSASSATPALLRALGDLDDASRRLVPEAAVVASPADDLLRGVRAAAAPATVVADDAAAPAAPTRAPLPAPLQLEQRLAMLELGVVVGEYLLALGSGRRLVPTRGEGLRVTQGRTPGGDRVLRFRRDDTGSGAAAPVGSGARSAMESRHIPGVEVTVMEEGVDVTLIRS